MIRIFKTYGAVILWFLAVSIAHAQTTADYFKKAEFFFGTYVHDGRVDYQSLVNNRSTLDDILDLGKSLTVAVGDAKTYQAFWINSYNLLVIKSVIDNYPLRSPLDKAGFFDGIEHSIGGEQITLNGIEHELLRGVFPEESRFHFVLVCAGLGCPPIIDKAYLPTTLETQLETQTRLALNDPNFIRVEKKRVRISQIFQWYKKDFTQGGLNLLEYINQFRTPKLPDNLKVSFYEYNWALNETE